MSALMCSFNDGIVEYILYNANKNKENYLNKNKEKFILTKYFNIQNFHKLKLSLIHKISKQGKLILVCVYLICLYLLMLRLNLM